MPWLRVYGSGLLLSVVSHIRHSRIRSRRHVKVTPGRASGQNCSRAPEKPQFIGAQVRTLVTKKSIQLEGLRLFSPSVLHKSVWRPGSALTSGKLIHYSALRERGLRAATGDEEQGGEGDFAVLYCDIFYIFVNSWS